MIILLLQCWLQLYRQFYRLKLKFKNQFIKIFGYFPFLPPPQPYWQNHYSPPPPLADMLSWAVWFKFLLNKVIANTCLFILTSISKQSASWKVLEICELCALSTDSRKTYSVNKYMYTGSSSYSFDWGGIIRWGGGGWRNGKDPIFSTVDFFIRFVSEKTEINNELFSSLHLKPGKAKPLIWSNDSSFEKI